ncbi:MAG: iron ABC transporter permease, partial [Eubacteriaceae bacterium]|nr:iron ABC transporter permease [Eubacteriaceae bacterium]
FVSSILSLVVTFAPDRAKNIMFWTMGSLASTNFTDALLLLTSIIIFGGVLLSLSRELNAFAVGEQNALHVGVDVKKVKLVVLISVSALIGVCVSIGGTIGFVGLVIPHMTRLVVGPNHKKLMPACVFVGASFLMLADLVARIILKPRELPIGVVTSFIGSITFIYIFYNTRRQK